MKLPAFESLNDLKTAMANFDENSVEDSDFKIKKGEMQLVIQRLSTLLNEQTPEFGEKPTKGKFSFLPLYKLLSLAKSYILCKGFRSKYTGEKKRNKSMNHHTSRHII